MYKKALFNFVTASKPLVYYTICSVVCFSIDLCGCNFLYNWFVQKLLFKGICSGDLEGSTQIAHCLYGVGFSLLKKLFICFIYLNTLLCITMDWRE